MSPGAPRWRGKVNDEKTTTHEPIEYEKPEIVDYGDLVDLTAGAWTGPGYVDGTFPSPPPLTFS